MLYVRHFPLTPEHVNAYLVAEPEAREALFVDAGEWRPEIGKFVGENSLKVVGIFVTHCHYDHVGGLAEFAAEFPEATIYCGAQLDIVCERLQRVSQGAKVCVGHKSATVLELPGHTPDQCLLYFADDAILFTGDALFAGSVGGTASASARDQQIAGLLGKVLTLPDDVRVYPGHGPVTTVGLEKLANPFLAKAG